MERHNDPTVALPLGIEFKEAIAIAGLAVNVVSARPLAGGEHHGHSHGSSEGPDHNHQGHAHAHAHGPQAAIRDTAGVLLDVGPDEIAREKLTRTLEADGNRVVDLHRGGAT